MPRLSLPDPESLTPEQRRVHDYVVSESVRGTLVGPFRAALLRPEILEKWHELGRALRTGATLPMRLRELAILLTARHWNAKVEWIEHVPPALKEGLAPELVRAIRDRRQPDFRDDSERDVHDFCSELLRDHTVSDATYQRTHAHLGPVGMVELTTVLGMFSLVAFTLIAHQLEPIPGRDAAGSGGLAPELADLMRLPD